MVKAEDLFEERNEQRLEEIVQFLGLPPEPKLSEELRGLTRGALEDYGPDTVDEWMEGSARPSYDLLKEFFAPFNARLDAFIREYGLGPPTTWFT